MDVIIGEVVNKLGYSCVKPHQKDVIEKALNGQDCLVVAPTGFGKTLMFESLPHCLPVTRKDKGAMVIVVSPLISLMKLQAKAMRSRGTNAVYLQVCLFCIF